MPFSMDEVWIQNFTNTYSKIRHDSINTTQHFNTHSSFLYLCPYSYAYYDILKTNVIVLILVQEISSLQILLCILKEWVPNYRYMQIRGIVFCESSRCILACVWKVPNVKRFQSEQGLSICMHRTNLESSGNLAVWPGLNLW